MVYRQFVILLFLVGSTLGQVVAQTTARNYVLSRTYKVVNAAETIPSSSSYAGSPRQVSTQITYFDGLGQPIQQSFPYQGPYYQDIFTRTDYDDQLRAAKSHLPLATENNYGPPYNDGKFVDQPDAGYYNNQLQVCTPTTYAYTQSNYELSPLNRTKETKAPGIGPSAAGVRQSFLVNAANSVKYYVTTGTTLTAIQDLGYFSANKLTYTETKDENDKTIQEYRNSYNQVVLKRVVLVSENLDTYYIYSESGLLRAVLQPKYQTDNSLSNSAFLYEYDGRGRLIKKKLPGVNQVTLSYDNRDRLTGMLDANNIPFYYGYDELNRQIEMGIVQGNVNQALVYTYYDDYAFANSYGSWDDFTNELGLTATDHFVTSPLPSSRKGLMTGKSVRMLNDDGSLGSWQRAVMYYDNKGRLIQTVRELYGLGSNATERVSYQLDFVGRPEKARTTQLNSSSTYRLDKTYAYDQADHLSYVNHAIYEGGVLKKKYDHIISNYNEIGQLQEKGLANSLLKIGYLYTPRGWLCNQGLNNGNTFSQNLSYDPNGNINQQTSSSFGAGQPSGSATYSYDGANRLTGYSTSGIWSGYNESGINYDKNGNITSLIRSYSNVVTNNLSYSYDGNKLNQVENSVPNTDPIKGFVNGASASNEMAYDGAGNLIKDANQGINNLGDISYNVINLPRQLTKSGQLVKYIYDATGAKRQVIASGIQTNYEGNFEYNANGTLARIGLEEGQLLRDGSGNYSVQYYIKDHLGNVRMVIKEDGNVIQHTEYYAFGMPFFKDTSSISTNKYLYNGKEQQPQTRWLDYGARMYDPIIARWMTVDPLAEISRRWSPYTYAYDNPLRFIDQDGMEATSFDRSERDDFGNVTFFGAALPGEGGIVSGTTKGVGSRLNSQNSQGSKNSDPPTKKSYQNPTISPFNTTTPPKGPLIRNTPIISPIIIVAAFIASVLQGDQNPKSPGNISEEYSPYIYREMATNPEGSWIQSPLEGAPNSRQMGVRTPTSNPAFPDVVPVGTNNMVGPSYTQIQGLSAMNPPPSTLRYNNTIIGAIKISNLPPGLGAINDHGDHYSIFPTANMNLYQYQTLLNSIPWEPLPRP